MNFLNVKTFASDLAKVLNLKFEVILTFFDVDDVVFNISLFLLHITFVLICEDCESCIFLNAQSHVWLYSLIECEKFDKW